MRRQARSGPPMWRHGGRIDTDVTTISLPGASLRETGAVAATERHPPSAVRREGACGYSDHRRRRRLRAPGTQRARGRSLCRDDIVETCLDASPDEPVVRRVVLDANGCVLALVVPGGPPSDVVRSAREGRVRSILSKELVDQAAQALARLGFPPPAVADARADPRDLTDVAPSEWQVVFAVEEFVNRLLGWAAAGGADAIVIGDRRHWLRFGADAGIPRLDPTASWLTSGQVMGWV